MNKDSKIYIAGHNGMVGSSILRKLHAKGYQNLIFKSYQKITIVIRVINNAAEKTRAFVLFSRKGHVILLFL